MTDETIMMTVRVIGSHEATVAKASAVVNGRVYTTTGTAKRDPADKNDPVVGKNLAVGRAVSRLGAKMEKLGMAQMRHNENMRVYKENQAKDKSLAALAPRDRKLLIQARKTLSANG